MFKVNNEDTRTTPLSLLLTSEHISHLVCFSISIVNFKHVIAGWVLSCDCEILKLHPSTE